MHLPPVPERALPTLGKSLGHVQSAGTGNKPTEGKFNNKGPTAAHLALLKSTSRRCQSGRTKQLAMAVGHILSRTCSILMFEACTALSAPLMRQLWDGGPCQSPVQTVQIPSVDQTSCCCALQVHVVGTEGGQTAVDPAVLVGQHKVLAPVLRLVTSPRFKQRPDNFREYNEKIAAKPLAEKGQELSSGPAQLPDLMLELLKDQLACPSRGDKCRGCVGHVAAVGMCCNKHLLNGRPLPRPRRAHRCATTGCSCAAALCRAFLQPGQPAATAGGPRTRCVQRLSFHL